MKDVSIHGPKLLPVLAIMSLLLFVVVCQPMQEGSQGKYATDLGTSAAEHGRGEGIKHRGTHVFGYLDSLNLQPFIQHNFDWITMVSYAVQEDYDSPTVVYYKGDSLKNAKRDSSWKSQIEIAHQQGFKVMLKPHLWLTAPSEGKWRSDIFPLNEENWKSWQENYRAYLSIYAHIAQQSGVELFCIGAEFTRLTVEKPEFWRQLIKELRTIYTGEITYAANWYNEYEQIPFWNELDYIGIQAYFPLVKHEYPNIQDLSKGWARYLPEMEAVAKQYNRKILFTEMGYKSTSNAAITPWEWAEHTAEGSVAYSLETQSNCYEAFFKTVWDKEWFAGVHIWQCRSDYIAKDTGVYRRLDFTPQGKPAFGIIAKGFK